MEENPEVIIVLFRTTNKKNTNKKNKLPSINPINTLKSLRSDDCTVLTYADRLTEGQKEVKALSSIFRQTEAHGNAETFLEILEASLEFDPEQIVYFLEDDYLHRPGWSKIIKEGLEIADYVSLYDHPDKYGKGPESLMYTKSTHWKFTVSTTMTFATKVKTLVYDKPIFDQLVVTGNPPDHQLFSILTQKLHRRLATPIPGYATHGEVDLLSPCIDWDEII